jgi:hypothetical protein
MQRSFRRELNADDAKAGAVVRTTGLLRPSCDRDRRGEADPGAVCVEIWTFRRLAHVLRQQRGSAIEAPTASNELGVVEVRLAPGARRHKRVRRSLSSGPARSRSTGLREDLDEVMPPMSRLRRERQGLSCKITKSKSRGDSDHFLRTYEARLAERDALTQMPRQSRQSVSRSSWSVPSPVRSIPYVRKRSTLPIWKRHARNSVELRVR